MIEININKDVGSYEAKLIWQFTARQTICVAIAAPLCWFIYKHASPVLSGDAAGFLMLIPAAIAFLFGWRKPYGMPMEKFIESVFVNMVLAPSHRKYKTENVHEKAFAVLEQHAKDAEVAENSERKLKTSGKKPRYKVSSEAVM